MTMFPKITFIANKRLALDAKFSQDRALRQTLEVGERFELPEGLATPEELILNRQLALSIETGDLQIDMDPGLPVMWRFPLFTAGSAAASTRTLLPNLPFRCQFTYIAYRVVTGVPATTVQISTAASGGTDITEALDSSGASPYVHATAQFPLLEKGTPVVANRSNGTVELIFVIMGLRVTV